MEKVFKEVGLLGISNVAPADICNDGECCDIVNMRNNNGLWSICGIPEKILESDNSGRSTKFIHCNNDYSHLISYDGKTIFWEADFVDGLCSPVRKAIADIDNVTSFESMGNVLMAKCDNGYQYLIFNKNSYSLIGEIDMPLLQFKLESPIIEIGSQLESYKLPYPVEIGKNFENYRYISNKIYNEAVPAMFDLNNKGRTFSTPFLVRYAIKLFDGSYIKPSAPILMISRDDIRSIFKMKAIFSYSDSESAYFIYNPNIFFKANSLWFKTLHLPSSEWDDIISSIDIFISNPLNIASNESNKVVYTDEYFNDPNNRTSIFNVNLEFPTLSDKEIKERLSNESLFYKIASYKPSVLRENINNYKHIYPPFTLDALVSQDILPIDNFSHYNFTGNVSFLYNSRLHIGNICRSLPKPFEIANFAIPDNLINGNKSELSFEGVNRCHIKVTINSSIGDKFVETDMEIPKDGYLTSYISYPDSRASLMEIWLEYDNDSKKYVSIPLTGSKVENMAYFINDDFKGIGFVKYNEDIPSNKQIDYENFPNLLRVSNSENPFCFSQKLSYNISSGEILNIATVTTELSQGRYGDFPLYIFTSDGIWALQHGDENVAYKSLLPVSRDIALSPKSITNIDNAIVFLSEKGLLIIRGSEVAQLSYFGLNRCDIIDDRVVKGKDFNIISNQEIIDDFKKHIINSYIEFNYNNRELLFLKEGENYLYSFSLNNGMWSRIKFQEKPLCSFLKIYPQLFVCDSEGNVYNLSREITDSSMTFLFTTRAIKGSNNFSFKHLKEVNFKGELDFIDNDMHIEISGSNYPDRGFRKISEFALNGSYYDGVRIPIYAPAYKYFRISGYGNGKYSMNINNILLSFIHKYGAKAR